MFSERCLRNQVGFLLCVKVCGMSHTWPKYLKEEFIPPPPPTHTHRLRRKGMHNMAANVYFQEIRKEQSKVWGTIAEAMNTSSQ